MEVQRTCYLGKTGKLDWARAPQRIPKLVSACWLQPSREVLLIVKEEARLAVKMNWDDAHEADLAHDKCILDVICIMIMLVLIEIN